MWLISFYEGLKMNEQVFVYGHELDETEIIHKYPFSLKWMKKKHLKKNKYTVTFDVRMAYAYRCKGYKIVLWGGWYRKMRVFVFKKQRITKEELPF